VVPPQVGKVGWANLPKSKLIKGEKERKASQDPRQGIPWSVVQAVRACDSADNRTCDFLLSAHDAQLSGLVCLEIFLDRSVMFLVERGVFPVRNTLGFGEGNDVTDARRASRAASGRGAQSQS